MTTNSTAALCALSSDQNEASKREMALLNFMEDLAESKKKLESTVHDMQRQIMEREQAEDALSRVNRELRAISKCHQVLIRATDEATLLKDICRVVCDQAGHRMAWVGYAENDDNKTVRAVAWAGVQGGYLQNANIVWSDTERGQGPTGTAIRTGKSVFTQDFMTDARFEPWREEALKRGYRSSIALPLKNEGGAVFGAFMIYSAAPNAFTAEEIWLSEGLADDMAFGVILLRGRARRAQAEAEIRKLNAQLEQRVADRTAELNRRVAELQAIYETVPVGLAVAEDAEGCHIRGNPTLERLTGIAAGGELSLTAGTPPAYRVCGARGEELVPSELPMQRACRGETVTDWILEIERANGEISVLQSNATPLRDENGKPMGAVGAFMDITESRRAEAALHQSEEKFSRVFQHAPMLMTLAELETGLLLDANEAFVAISGFNHEEAIGKTTVELGWVAPADRRRAIEVLRTQGRITDLEVTAHAKDGRAVFCLANAEIIIVAGKPLLLTIASDVTARKQAEAALHESEEFRRAVMDNSPDAIYVKDRQSHVLLANPEYLRIAGKTAEQVLGKTALELYDDPAIGRILLEDDRRVMESGKAETFEEMVVTSEGWRTYQATKAPRRDAQGNVIGLIGISHDITARKRTEEQIRILNTELQQRAILLEAANKELESFSYSVSHDLRAPLRAIDGFSRILLEEFSGKLSSEGQEYLRRVCAASQRMGQLIDDLLQLSRTARKELQRGLVNLSNLPIEIAGELKRTDLTRSVEFKIQPDLITHGDPSLLRVVLENLLGNAWKFTGKEPAAAIEFLRVAGDAGQAYCVRDNGAGFDPAYSAKLYGAFQRLHNPNEFPGTGIGLATVQRIIHRHGGRVWAEGAVGKGAAFYFTLPAERSEL